MRQDDLSAAEPEDISLCQGTVHIKKVGRAARRSLKLEAHQILPLKEYIDEILPPAQRENHNEKRQTLHEYRQLSRKKRVGLRLEQNLKKALSDLQESTAAQKFKN